MVTFPSPPFLSADLHLSLAHISILIMEIQCVIQLQMNAMMDRFIHFFSKFKVAKDAQIEHEICMPLLVNYMI